MKTLRPSRRTDRVVAGGVLILLIGCGMALWWPGLAQDERVSILTAFLTFVAVLIALLSAVYAQQAAFLARQTALEQRLERRLEKLQRLAAPLRELQDVVIPGDKSSGSAVQTARRRLNDELATFPSDLLREVHGVAALESAQTIKEMCPAAIKELDGAIASARQQLAAAETAF